MQPIMPRTRRNRQSGTTSLEVLLAAAVGLTVMGAFASFNKHQLGTLTNQSRQLSMQGTARSIAQLFAREVRRADSIELVPADNGIRIRADVNLNGTINGGGDDGPDEDVIYGIYDDSVWRKAGGPDGNGEWESLLGGVNAEGVALVFSDAHGNDLTYAEALALAAADPFAFGQIRTVRLNIEVKNANSAGARPYGAGMVADATLRKRFFLTAPTFGVDDAIYSDFDIDEFLSSIGEGAPGDDTPVADSTSVPPPAPTASPTSAPQCLSRNASCSTKNQCCSGICRSNGKCG